MSASRFVYVTVGNHDQPFDRLLREMDRIAAAHGFETVMQTGHSNYEPRHAKWSRFYPLEEAESFFQRADAVAGHAGIGTIISARRHGAPLVICPRRSGAGEHFNDHQLEICAELAAHPRAGVSVAMQPENVEPVLLGLLRGGKRGAAPDPAIGIKAALGEFVESL